MASGGAPASTEDAPYLAPEEILKPRVCLSGLTADMWQESHYSAIYRFFCDENCRVLIAYIDKNMGLVVDNVVPSTQVGNGVIIFC